MKSFYLLPRINSLAVFFLSILIHGASTAAPLPTYFTIPATLDNFPRVAGVTLYQASQSIIFEPGFTSEDGASFVAEIVPQASQVPQATNLSGTADLNLNWIQSSSFDETGALVTDEKQFLDNNGQKLQTQDKVFFRVDPATVYTHVLASQPVRDARGRPALTTMAAPIDFADFSYQPNFTRHNTAGNNYSHQNFDLYSNGAVTSDKTITPDPLWDASGGAPLKGTLAWYYSTSNTWEPYTPTSNFPYSRQTYYADGTGNAKKSAGIGDAFKMGSGHEGASFVTPVANELSFYISVRNKFFATTDLGSLPTSLQNQAIQMVSRDANGSEKVSITDRAGKSLMVARPGTDILVTNTVSVGGPSASDMNIWYFKLHSVGAVTISGGTYGLYDMNTEQPVSGFTSGNTLPAGYYKLVNTGTTAISIGYSNGYTEVSYNFYNQLGQLVASIAPEGVKKLYGTNGAGLSAYTTKTSIPFVNLYNYDEQGRLVGGQDPDRGVSQFIYRNDGKLRFSQNAAQVAGGSYNYTNFDLFGRQVESGTYMPGSGGVLFGSASMTAILENTDQTGGLMAGTKTDVTVTIYDIPDATYVAAGYQQDPYFLSGMLSAVKRYSSILNNSPAAANLVSASWYNYDEEGKIAWTIKYINGLGSDVTNANSYKTTDYSYDVMGNIVKKIFQQTLPAETFIHYYDYDPANKLLWHVYTGTSIATNATRQLQATYYYYLHGGVKRVELGTNLQGIDYAYTLQGALKAINNNNKSQDPGNDGNNGLAADAFGEVLDYYTGDYVNARAGISQFNGVNNSPATDSYVSNIKAMTWYSEKPSSVPVTTPAADAPNAYIYQYDSKYQFTESTWGTGLGFGTTPATYTSTSYYKQKVGDPANNLPAYDGNGNILNLQRTDGAGTLIDKFAYNYTANTNQLSSVVNNATGTPQTYATFSYNPVGQVTAEATGDGSPQKYMDYDGTGKVIAVYQDAGHSHLLAAFVYDELGKRVKKLSYNTSWLLSQITYYVGDVIYTQTVSPTGTYGTVAPLEYEIRGNSRLGVYYPSGAISAYELSDHLGNVRAVIAQSGTTYEVRMYSDYYPYGMVLRYAGTNDYRYGYQGQNAEMDPETGWNNFQLRMYDSRIGRWLQYDPKGQFYSPYMAMGNDPVGETDPDGGGKTDYFKNAAGDVFYAPTSVSSITDDQGVVWTNFAKSYDVFDNIFLAGTWGEDGKYREAPKFKEPYQGTISNFKPRFWQRQENGNFLQNLFYSTVNSFYVTGQNLGGKQVAGRNYAFNLNGSVTTPNENVMALASSSTFFIPAAETETTIANLAEKGSEKVLPKVGRIFWNGEEGRAAAEAFADDMNFKTLGQTRAGKNLEELIRSRGVPWEGPGGAKEMWARLSAVYARGADEFVYFFSNPEGFSPTSIWAETEMPILQSRGVQIIKP